MDPNLFAIDSERLFEVLMTIIILSLIVERALAIIFENRAFVDRFAGKSAKEPITMAVAFAVCRSWDFDALSVILVKDKTQLWGHVITAAVIAGGSKASIKLFHDVFKIMSSAERERQDEKLKRAGKAAPSGATIPPPPGMPSVAPAPGGTP